MTRGDEIIKWTGPNGNPCFRFFERKPFERVWIIAAIAIVFFAVVIVELIVNGSHTLLLPVFICFFVAVLWWLTIPMKANESEVLMEVTLIEDFSSGE